VRKSTPTAGKMITAMRASTHSRMNITVRRATMVAT
jgi:hypothetical protein